MTHRKWDWQQAESRLDPVIALTLAVGMVVAAFMATAL